MFNDVKPLVFGDFRLMYHEYKECGVMGVGAKGVPIINMDPYIDHSLDEELHLEMCTGMALSKGFEFGRCNGALPPSEVEKYFGNDCNVMTLANLDRIDPNGVHRKNILDIVSKVSPKEERFIHQAVFKYCYFALGSVIPWFFVMYIKQSSFFEKGRQNDSITEDGVHFPKLLEYVKTLPFKEVGRIKVFCTYPGAGVLIHRDGPVQEHSDHNINLFFGQGYRPTFVYDEVEKRKIYLEEGSRSYYFNNRDFHGVDSEPSFRYTVRVDGTFTDEMCETLSLVNGKTWCEDYLKGRK